MSVEQTQEKGQIPSVGSGSLVRRHVVALGYKSMAGTIVVTDVLCMNFPELPTDVLASLSERLEQWSREYAAKPNNPVRNAGGTMSNHET